MKNFKVPFLAVVSVLLLSGCADAVTCEAAAAMNPVGFFTGFWHGIIAPIAFVVSLFDDGVAVYAVYNSGAWYDLGFLLALTSGSTGLVRISIGSRQDR